MVDARESRMRAVRSKRQTEVCPTAGLTPGAYTRGITLAGCGGDREEDNCFGGVDHEWGVRGDGAERVGAEAAAAAGEGCGGVGE